MGSCCYSCTLLWNICNLSLSCNFGDFALQARTFSVSLKSDEFVQQSRRGSLQPLMLILLKSSRWLEQDAAHKIYSVFLCWLWSLNVNMYRHDFDSGVRGDHPYQRQHQPRSAQRECLNVLFHCLQMFSDAGNNADQMELCLSYQRSSEVQTKR